ncbi:LAFA_0G24256g1_1 [Lachancea sp. 'fantastica']|nr:LAFA_0G24256g1_1 [Lachancea sp. 'fantastica']
MFNPGSNSRGLASWSKTGMLAYVDNESDHSNLCITLLETINGTNWRLRPCKKYTIHPNMLDIPNTANSAGVNGAGNSNGSQKTFNYLSSIYWSNTHNLGGDQLALFDDVGNLTMANAGQTLEGISTLDNLVVLFQDNGYKIHSQLVPLQECSSDKKITRSSTKRETHSSIVEFYWIGTHTPLFTLLGARKDSATSSYKSQVEQVQPLGITHPTSVKCACLGLRRGGQLDFWYQFSNSKDYKKISLHLNSIQDSRAKQVDWIQCSKFAQMDESQAMLIGTFSRLTETLAFYKLTVDWNNSSQNSVSDPKLQLQHVLEFSPEFLSEAGEPIELKGFQLLSAPNDKASGIELLLNYEVVGASRSVVKRYKFGKYTPSSVLCAVFGVSDDEEQPLPVCDYAFEQQEIYEFDSSIYTIEFNATESVVIFRLKNGHSTIYDRRTWTSEQDLAKVQNRDVMSSPFSTGLRMPITFPTCGFEWSQISPSLGGVISKVTGQDSLHFDPIEASITDNAENDTSVALAFAFAFVCSGHRQSSGEDLSIAIKTHLLKLGQVSGDRAEKLLKNLIITVYQLFGLTPDASKELKDKLTMSRPVQKTMLLQSELACSFTNNSIYNMSRTALSLRNILFAFNGVSRNIQVLIHHSATMNFQQPNGKLYQFAFSKQDLIYSLIPSAKWFVKLVTYLTQQMIVLVNSPNDKENSLVLGIFGSKMTRQLLLSVLGEIKKVIHLITKFPETSFPVLNESSIYLRKVLGDSPVNFEKFETFLADVNNKFSLLEESRSNTSMARDTYLIIDGDIPPEVSQLKDFLLSYSNTAVLSHIKPAEVYFSDTRGLRILSSEIFQPCFHKLLQPLEKGLVIPSDVLSDDVPSASLCVIEIDDISREPLNSGKYKLKRCCRCGAVTRAGYPVTSENTIFSTSVTTKRWTSLYTKSCICSGLLYELDRSSRE